MARVNVMIADALAMPVFQRALLACLLASITCGIVGVFVVVRRMTSISGGLSHAAFGGVGLGYLIGIGPSTGALVFSLLCSVVLAVVYRRQKESLDTIISMLWSLGMAIGIICLSLVPGGAPDLTHFLFGSVLFVPKDYLLSLLVLDGVLIAGVFLGRELLQAVAFDEEFSEVRGLPVDFLFFTILAVVAIAVVVLMKVAGVILTIALLSMPAVIAKHWSSSLTVMMVFSVFLSAVMSSAGLFATYGISKAWGTDLPTGPLIILLLAAVYLASSLLVRRRRTSRLS